ncbi:MAG: hypothetical protein KC503_44315 [Myxococcales bacterium]|nr:hypothetical protein [Myxococcales bacterium]
MTPSTVKLRGARVRLDDSMRVGVGGEAEVYRLGDEALKVFHAPAPRARDHYSRVMRDALALKQRKLAAFPRALPAQVVAPCADGLLLDKRDAVCGYAMPLVEGADHLGRLGRRSAREGVIDNNQLFALFRELYLALEALHARGVCVGDLNPENVLYTVPAAAGAAPRAHIIDADSMQWDDLPCIVGHERTLDPRLYGVDLAAAPRFDAASDWYAFAVLLFSCLLYVHPYGGVHPRLPTLLRRAEAAASIFDDQVRTPRTAADPSVLPEALRDYFIATFQRAERAAPAATLLEARWRRCDCGVEHARPRCPACSRWVAVGGVAAQPAAPTHVGRLTALTLLRTRGRLLDAVVQGSLRTIVFEGGVARRENGEVVMRGELAPGLRFAINGASTWVGRGSELVAIERERAAARASTATLGVLPAFACNSSACYRIAGGYLVESVATGRAGAAGNANALRREQRIGQVLAGQTWIAAGERLGVGFYRAGEMWRTFIWRCGRPGLVDVALPAGDVIGSRIVDAAASFDDGGVLLAIATERAGALRTSLYVIGADGRLVAAAAGAPDDSPLLATVRGKALRAGRIVAASDAGLVAARVDRHSGQIVVERCFDEAAPYVSGDVELLAGPGGSLYVVTTKDITQLSMR